MPFSSSTSGSVVAECQVLNLTPPSKIGTGICFLDHMIDQLTSHGQVGVTLRCGLVDQGQSAQPGKRDAAEAPTQFFVPLRDYAAGMAGRPHDRDIFIACGAALGLALRRVVEEVAAKAASKGGSGERSAVATFCCPLDEAFAEAILDLQPSQPARRGQCTVDLQPYGSFANSASGRQWVGRYRTELTPLFWTALASSLQADLSLRKVRGGNAHHILESTFKSFARALRAALDRLADGTTHGGCASPGEGPVAQVVVPSDNRRAERKRATKETTIEVMVDLNEPWLESDTASGGDSAWTGHVMTATKLRATIQPTSRVSTGIPTLDRILTVLAKNAGIKLIVHCEGDRHIDDHHTAEDVAITLGQCLHEALGDKAGLARMGCAEGKSGTAIVRAVMDLSNRPHYETDLPLDEEYVGAAADPGLSEQSSGGGGGEAGDGQCGNLLSCEMLHHVFLSLTLETRATCHVEIRADQPEAKGHTLDVALAAAEAYGAALSRAIRVDPRRRGAVASSKGTLSK